MGLKKRKIPFGPFGIDVPKLRELLRRHSFLRVHDLVSVHRASRVDGVAVAVARTRRRGRNGVGGRVIRKRDCSRVRIRGEAVDVDEGGEEIVVGGKVVGGRRRAGGGERIHEHEHRHVVGARSAVEGGGDRIDGIWRLRIWFLHERLIVNVRILRVNVCCEEEEEEEEEEGDNDGDEALSLSLYLR